uniref:FMRFamide-like neuropeptides 14 n=1 Tax=Steinernema glaseri TaxID=37863 RepID=A0A1I7ZXP0_9BILA
MLGFVVIATLLALSNAESEPGAAAVVDEFCQRYSQMSLCHLHGTLQQALTELSFLFGEDGVPTGPNDPILMSKRKSAFVRFGKRAADEGDQVMEKRKSAFVRFGRSLPAVEQKRKNSYVRFD